MIPKIIHFCWFSDEKYHTLIRKCIESWKNILSDYEIKCWNYNSFNFNSLDFTKEAISVKQYAAAADYVRLYALYTQGGIYLDSDVEVFKKFDDLLNNVFFTGIEQSGTNDNFGFRIEAGIMGCIPNQPFIKECMEYYENNHFIHQNGDYDNLTTIAPEIYTRVFERYGFQRINQEQILSEGIHIYPRNMIANGDYVYNYNNIEYSNLYAIHHNMNSWSITRGRRGWLYEYCYKHNLMDKYRKLESIRVFIKKETTQNNDTQDNATT